MCVREYVGMIVCGMTRKRVCCLTYNMVIPLSSNETAGRNDTLLKWAAHGSSWSPCAWGYRLGVHRALYHGARHVL